MGPAILFFLRPLNRTTDALARAAGLIRDRDHGTDGFRLMPSLGGQKARLDPHGDIFARSILLHELVHHLQNVSGKFDTIANRCAQHSLKESDAYEIQNRYLASMRDGHHAFPVDLFFQ